MSNYGDPPSDPYGQDPQDPNFQGPAGGYGQSPYGGQPHGQPGYGAPQGVTFAHWGTRVAASLMDWLIMMIAYLPAVIGVPLAQEAGAAGAATLLTFVGLALYLGVFIWNICIKQGKTGYSIGKGIMGIKLVSANTGQPIGAGVSFARQLAHIVDALPCYIGFFWPLFDSKRQTFADKIMGTYVIDQPMS